MKVQKFLGTALAVVLGCTMSMTAFAQENDLQLTLGENGSFSYGGSGESGWSFDYMIPGETKTATTLLKNEYGEADFYISTEPIKTFEEDGALNGYYDVAVSVIKDGVKTPIYDTTLGWYERENDSLNGLMELKRDEDGKTYIYLTTLKDEESAVVSFSISLDGETVDNTYKSKDAIIDFDYQAVYVPTTSVVTVAGEPSVNKVERKNTKYVTTTTILDDEVALVDVPTGVRAAKTGDTYEVYIYAGLLVLACVLFLMTFKKNKKDKAAMIVTVLLVSTISMSAKAEEANNYLVTYRAGDIGTFEHVTDSEQSSVTVIESNDYYVTYMVPAGVAYPAYPEVHIENESYVVDYEKMLGLTKGTVSGNTEIVLEYTKLTSPVSYEVIYQTVGGVVLDKRAEKGNVGQQIELARNFSGYRVVSEQTVFTLDSSAKNNEFVIIYDLDTAGATVSYQYVPGGSTTVYTDVDDIVYLPGTTIVTSTPSRNVYTLTPGAVIPGDANGAMTVTQNNGQQAGMNNGNAAVFNPGQLVEPDNGLTDDQGEMVGIEDEDVPLIDVPEETTTETTVDESSVVKETGATEIVDEEVPTTSTIHMVKEHYPVIIATVLIVAVACGTAVIFARKQKKVK